MNLSFILIFTCLVIGALLRRSGRLPENAAKSFNAFVIWVSLPSVVLLQVPSLVETLRSSEGVRAMDLAGLVAMPWLLFAGSFFLFRAIGKRLGWARTEIGALILTAGLGNTAFIGYPLIDAFFGREGVRLAVLTDQPGTFLVVSILGLILATLYSPGAGRTVSARRIFRSVATFPPFVALLIALAWALSGTFSPTGAPAQLFERISFTLVPLALVSVGFQLRVSRDLLRRRFTPVGYGLFFKLIFAPFFFVLLYGYAFGLSALPLKVAVLESGMAPMITAAVVAEEFGLDAEIANLMVGVGIPLSLLTVSLWHLLPSLR